MSGANPFAAFAFDGVLGTRPARPESEATRPAPEPAASERPRKQARAWRPVKIEDAAAAEFVAASRPQAAGDTGGSAAPVAGAAGVTQTTRPRKMSSKYADYRTTTARAAAAPHPVCVDRAEPAGAVAAGAAGSQARALEWSAAEAAWAALEKELDGDAVASTSSASTGSGAAPPAVKVEAQSLTAAGGRDPAAPEEPRAPWRAVFETIRRHRALRDATVDAFHRYLLQLRSEPEGDFLVLVAGLLSVQARDNVAMAAMRRLRAAFDNEVDGGTGAATADSTAAAATTAAEVVGGPGDLAGGATATQQQPQQRRGLCVDAVCQMPLAELEQLLNTLNFFRSKAGYIKGCAEALQGYPHNGRVPRTQQKLQKLPGVGPKVALLVLSVGFAQGDAGIVVDTHVHRVVTRLGWAPPRAARTGAAASAEDTRAVLQSFVPADDWPDFTTVLIGFGQKTCLSRTPRCGECPVARECPSAAPRGGHV